jgi:hypothetical protein
MASPSDEQLEHIRLRAHQLWEAAGQPEGREQEFWFEAEREITKRDATNNPEEKSSTFTE